MQFATPESFYLLLLLPGFYGLHLWSTMRKKRFAAKVGDVDLVARLFLRTSLIRERMKPLLLATSILFLVLALARPQWGQGDQEMYSFGVDVMLVLDTSFSMDATDVPPSRIDRARYVASQLIDNLEGNRIGLVVFAGGAFVQCPLTLDYGAAKIFLDTVTTGIVPEPGTNIAEAVNSAVLGFQSRNSEHRVIVLLTDGDEETGRLDSIGEKIREEGIVIHAVGMGTPSGEPIPVRNESGEVSDYVRDESGQPVLSRLNERALSALAIETGGSYFRVSERDEEIEVVSGLIGDMEGAELQSQVFNIYEERFYWPLAVALIFLLVDTLVPRQRRSLIGVKT